MKAFNKIIIAMALLTSFMSCSYGQMKYKEPVIISTSVLEKYDDNTPREVMVTFQNNTKMWFKVFEHSKLSVLSPYEGRYSGDVTIPSKVKINGKDYPVTSIASESFDGEEITSVSIPNSVTRIGWSAFEHCEKLTSITIPGSVKNIGEMAFSYCHQLTSVSFMEGVEYIGLRMFEGCTSLTSVSIPKSITIIGESAFKECTSLTSMDIPKGVAVIGREAFKDCTGLTSINIPQSVEIIEWEAFNSCSSLTTLTLPQKIKTIEGGAFHGTGWYNSQPNGLIVIAPVVYEYKGEAPEGTSVIIPDFVTTICDGAFANKKGISSIEIPKSVTNIGYHAFEGTAWLENQPDGLVRIGNAIYTYKGNIPDGAVIIPDGETHIYNYAFDGRHYDLVSVTLPNSVTSIGQCAFRGCNSLASINIPNSVTSIGAEAFRDCGSLTSINIPNGVTRIEAGLFYDCKKLADVTIPNGVTSIEGSAFKGCDRLTTITIPSSVKNIGNSAFGYCDNLSFVTIQNPNLKFNIEDIFAECDLLQYSKIESDNGSQVLKWWVFGKWQWDGNNVIEIKPNEFVYSVNGKVVDKGPLDIEGSYIYPHGENGVFQINKLEIYKEKQVIFYYKNYYDQIELKKVDK